MNLKGMLKNEWYYVIWEKFWKNPQATAIRQKANAIATK
jgi:uncharacterized membrane protein